MVSALLLMSLAAGPVRVAVGPIVFSDASADQAKVYVEYLVQRLRQEGMLITSQAEVMAALGLERQRQLLGCSSEEAATCLAELVGALGTDGLLTGSSGELGGRRVVTLKIVSSGGQTLASSTAEAPDAERVLDSLETMARELTRGLALAFPGRVASSGFRVSRGVSIGLMIGGGAVAVGGVVLNLLAREDNRRLYRDPSLVADVYQLDATLGRLRTMEVLGWVSVGVGAAGVVAGLVSLLVFRERPALALTAVPGGALVTFGGGW